jgi:hypothetical protein
LEVVDIKIFPAHVWESVLRSNFVARGLQKGKEQGLPTAAKNDISEEILNYLFKHPDANDTLEGITEWWLLSQRISHEMKRVKAAVLRLVEEGWIIEIKGNNSTVRYRLNPKKRKESKW